MSELEQQISKMAAAASALVDELDKALAKEASQAARIKHIERELELARLAPPPVQKTASAAAPSWVSKASEAVLCLQELSLLPDPSKEGMQKLASSLASSPEAIIDKLMESLRGSVPKPVPVSGQAFGKIAKPSADFNNVEAWCEPPAPGREHLVPRNCLGS